MNFLIRSILVLSCLTALPASLFAADALPTVPGKVAGMETRAGFMTLHLDANAGKVWLEIPPPSGPRGFCMELLYVHGLTQGLGSNPVGLDRGQISDGQVLHIRRVGPKVLFEQINLGYRARTENPLEAEAVRESFATSVIWAADIAALDANGRSLVDFTGFVVRDHHDVSGTLKATEQGSYALDTSRSALDPQNCLAFPDNVELEATLTFGGSDPGAHVSSTSPVATSVTLTGHISLIRLPDPGYRPRAFDPRIGVFGIGFLDYAAPLAGSMDVKWICRHRLEKTDPSQERSPVKKPIVFYVDRGAPPAIKRSLIEGAACLADAFEAAGFVDAFRVEVMPEGVHPLDVRYNVIEWVHRSTRGWSYGGGIIDPRTGEFLKGHVNLGSLRVRQDRRLFEALTNADLSGTGGPDDPVEIALARIRQLSAHEVGHALGMAHNFAASTYDDRASVMDYPAPLLTPADNGVDLSRAYGVGIGTWDALCIRYAYSEYADPVQEQAGLDGIVREALQQHQFVSDADARSPASSDPRGSLWDNGADPVAALASLLLVRQQALARFGEHNVPMGQPLAELEEAFALVYYLHRYQVEAAIKVVGGMETPYAVRGAGQSPLRIVSAERQRQALDIVLDSLMPVTLDVPEPVLQVLRPRPFGYGPNRELFAGNTWPAFDALGAAATATDQVVVLLLHPNRLARLIDFHRRDAAMPDAAEVVSTLIERVFESPRESARHRAVRRAVQRATLDRLLELADRGDASPAVRAVLEAEIERLSRRLGSGEDAQLAAMAGDLNRYLNRAATGPRVVSPSPEMPPGSPIGALSLQGCSLD